MTSRPDLRPRTIGENLDAGFKLFTSNFKVLITVAAIVLVPVAVLTAAISATLGSVDLLDLVSEAEDGVLDFTGIGSFFAVFAINAVITGIASLIVQAAVVKVIGDAYQGHDTHWQGAISLGVRKAIPVFLTGLLIAVSAIGLLIAAGIVVAIVASFSDALAITTALFLFVGVGVSVFTLVYVAVPSLIVEDLGPVGAIRRSIRLVWARFWPTFWTAVLAYVIVIVISVIVGGIVQTAVIIPAALDSASTGELSGGLISAVSNVSSAVVSIFTTPFLAAVGIAVYFDLRVRLEGFDLELLARDMEHIDPTPPAPGSDDDPFGLDSPPES